LAWPHFPALQSQWRVAPATLLLVLLFLISGISIPHLAIRICISGSIFYESCAEQFPFHSPANGAYEYEASAALPPAEAEASSSADTEH